MTLASSHTLALAERIATVLGWHEANPFHHNESRRWVTFAGDSLVLYSDGIIHFTLADRVKVCLSYVNDDQTFNAELVYLPLDSPPTPTARDIAHLHVANMATEGMLSVGAINAEDNELLRWLRLPPTGMMIPSAMR